MLNAGVVLVTLTEPKLRKKAVMLIVTSLAVSDFIIETYSVSLASARKRPYTDFLNIMEPFCHFAGFIWMVGIFRYHNYNQYCWHLNVTWLLFIVWSQTFAWTAKTALFFILISWLLAFHYCSPAILWHRFIHRKHTVPTSRSKSSKPAFCKIQCWNYSSWYFSVPNNDTAVHPYIRVREKIRKQNRHQAGGNSRQENYTACWKVIWFSSFYPFSSYSCTSQQTSLRKWLRWRRRS